MSDAVAGERSHRGRRPLRVGVVQLAVADGDTDANVARAAALVRGAPAADLYVLPELFTTGYALDAWERAARDDTPRALAALQALADERGAWIAGSTIAQRDDGALVNRLHVLAPGARAAVATYDKAHLFAPMGEPERLGAGDRRVRVSVGPADARAEAALSICFDLRFPEHYRRDAADGAPLFLVVSEWPHPRSETLRLLARARAAENQAWLILANRTGPARDGTAFCGRSCVVAPTGEVVAEAAEEETVLVADVDVEAAERLRAAFPVLPLRLAGIDY